MNTSRIPSAPAAIGAVGAGHGDRERVLLPDVAHVERDLARRAVAAPVRARRRAAAKSSREQLVGPRQPRASSSAHDPRPRRGLRQVGAEQAPGGEVACVRRDARSRAISSSRASSVPKSGPAPPNAHQRQRRAGRCPRSTVISRIAFAMFAAAIVRIAARDLVDARSRALARAARARARAASRSRRTPPASSPVAEHAEHERGVGHGRLASPPRP